MSLSTDTSLLTALLDLELVVLLRDAIRTADLSSGAGANASSSVGSTPALPPAATYESTPSQVHEPHLNARPIIHITDKIEPRFAYHQAVDCRPFCPCPPVVCEDSKITPSPIQSPWAVMPWQFPPAPVLKIKLVTLRPDNTGVGPYKGSVLDCVI